ncbi:RnfABCDGE type electron transport complex subunit B [Psychrobacter sp. FDAARGOS_221]|uniref:RnfABCDGE type electron transport complex subunit B n=1 Tax=Psychrobacter sp. FDAARGOS_221 TaxID=1975705 RepID=UPI000BB56295|nr:RnfABCDGE type electron transport complex subunit B [Psychrobacter sp. FDAARGOS_221]PNK61643.1 iron-sulfur protein [Psychrobacter sp. FDAARGOS_221]
MIPERLDNLPILFDRLNLQQLSAEQQQTIAAVDACLPQTQCGLCDHSDGCLPYAVAIVTEDEPHNRCVPGGQPVSNAIATIMQRETLIARESPWPVDPNTQRPTEVRAVIREDDCIGCTKCIPACPVDAIVGTGKHMHTIITDLCTGCELCLPPCPVDCIDLVQVPRASELETAEYRDKEQAHLRGRYHTHLNRVAQQMTDKSHAKPVTSMVETLLGNASHQSLDIDAQKAKATIAAAKLRTKIKKLEKQLSVRANDKKQAELDDLKQQLAQLD